ncbi:8-amino-7-oxononanoate synthase [Candidatus Berkiella cookevillensis]|uniref:8-amino-7-oxononanoate synthase n=1 Tax=Candidatus Berkiella cookevillensis TaxID=437022 RepID=A0A0Q9YPC2_9GAMM|nr:aminotransferase class I/II-fold pyridoxal phosphate-dependent enzyme [Candidatus Berkiella cookevillensis]MCS5709014.1 8-amino-7-oxononanoate synthase [Candidatus Berkiella cookevillensis]
MSAKQCYQNFLNKQREQHLLRGIPANIKYDLDFSNNDYLHFSQHPSIIQAAQQALALYGSGSKASRLITHQQSAVLALESLIAKDKHSEKALAFCSGFQANVSVLAAVLDKKILGGAPLVFCDKLNHASLHLGCELAGVKQIRYRHLDMNHLEWQLKKHASTSNIRFIISESVFGMDGDIADLSTLIRLAKDYNALLYIDEAHSTGLFGPNGYGHSTEFPGEIDMIMGTFSKALGCFGAYVACSQTLYSYLLNRCQGLIYTTLMPPVQLATMQAAWELVPTAQKQVQALFELADYLRENLSLEGFDIGNSQTNIVPIRLHDPKQVLNYQQKLSDQGIAVAAIRPPSVMPLESRLRIALSLRHQKKDIDMLFNALKSLQQQG